MGLDDLEVVPPEAKNKPVWRFYGGSGSTPILLAFVLQEDQNSSNSDARGQPALLFCERRRGNGMKAPV